MSLDVYVYGSSISFVWRNYVMRKARIFKII